MTITKRDKGEYQIVKEEKRSRNILTRKKMRRSWSNDLVFLSCSFFSVGWWNFCRGYVRYHYASGARRPCSDGIYSEQMFLVLFIIVIQRRFWAPLTVVVVQNLNAIYRVSLSNFFFSDLPKMDKLIFKMFSS